jgi:uncharacterized membrane protein YhaH (DUF805 family)
MKKYFTFDGRAGRAEYWSIWIGTLAIAPLYGMAIDLSEYLLGFGFSNFSQ